MKLEGPGLWYLVCRFIKAIFCEVFISPNELKLNSIPSYFRIQIAKVLCPPWEGRGGGCIVLVVDSVGVCVIGSSGVASFLHSVS